MSPDAIRGILDDWMVDDDSPLEAVTRSRMKQMSLSGFSELCSLIGARTRTACDRQEYNLSMDFDFVNQSAERIWLNENHYRDADKLLLAGASRKLVETKTGLHSRQISKMRERLKLGRSATTPPPTAAEQNDVIKWWQAFEGLTDVDRIIAVHTKTKISLDRIWEIVSAPVS